MRAKVEELIGDSCDAKVELNNIVDDSIIDGFIYKSDSIRVDASVRGELQNIRNGLVERNRKLV